MSDLTPADVREVMEAAEKGRGWGRINCSCKEVVALCRLALAVLEQQEGIACEHGVKDGDYCEPCNKAYKEAANDQENR